MYLVFIWIHTSNRRASGASGSNSAYTLYSSPGRWARGLEFLAGSPLPWCITAFYILFFFYFFIYHSSSFLFEHLIFCEPQFSDLYIYLYWQTCMPLGQDDKSLWFYTICVCHFWFLDVQGRLCKELLLIEVPWVM